MNRVAPQQGWPGPAAACSYGSAIAIIGGLFFVFGFVTWLNGPLITFVQLAFELSVFKAFLVTFVFYLAYFFLALPASAILDRTGMKRGMALGLGVMAAGSLAFGEFCVRRWYPGALSGLFVIGAGLAILQTAANPYISILGPIESGARRIAIMGMCNKSAGILAPIVLGALVLHGMGDLSAQVAAAQGAARAALLDEFAARVHLPYLAMAGVLAALGWGILLSPLPDVRTEPGTAAAESAALRRRLRDHPHVWLGALAIFACMATEVMAGDAIGTYGRGFGLPLDQTKLFTSFTLGGMLLGYIVGFMVTPRFVTQERYLGGSALLGGLLTVAALFTHGYVSVGFVAALGFANAMMWPAIFPLAVHGLGRLIERGSALLIMGIAGGAIVPQLFAYLRQSHDFQGVFALLMLPCYAYVWHFATRGCRAG